MSKVYHPPLAYICPRNCKLGKAEAENNTIVKNINVNGDLGISMNTNGKHIVISKVSAVQSFFSLLLLFPAAPVNEECVACGDKVLLSEETVCGGVLWGGHTGLEGGAQREVGIKMRE